MTQTFSKPLYSLIIAVQPKQAQSDDTTSWRVGEITVDWVDFTREKSVDRSPPSPARTMPTSGSRRKQISAQASRSIPGAGSSPTPSPSKSGSSTHTVQNGQHGQNGHADSANGLSLQPLLAHFPGPNPLDTSAASGLTTVGRGVVHLFRHAPPQALVASLDAHPVGESSRSVSKDGGDGEWAGDRAEGEDGSLIAILAVPAWMRPADFLEFIGGWATCLEGVRMIREATTPNRSIVLLKFRDPLQASDFLVIFTGRPFSTLDARETCHPIRIHHLVLHHTGPLASSPSPTATTAIPAFPPSIYASRAKSLSGLLKGVPQDTIFELPSCPVCLERLDSTVTGLVTLPCAHTFDCDCLRKWGDSRCPVCRVSHLLLSSSSHHPSAAERDEVTRLTKCATCSSTSNNWICVVCGVVGCGRYDPGKGHARRHWEESGHVLAMELETQRVWDYKGDNYVHRLIQTRNDGKLVELPSASSLVTPSVSRTLPLSSTLSTPQRPSAPSSPSARPSSYPAAHQQPSGLESHTNAEAGPSTGDLEKISTIESITLEYSYLLSSQLEAMRQHYESISLEQSKRLDSIAEITARADAAERARIDAEKAKAKAEKRADKASELSRSLQASLSAERSMAEGLSVRVKALKDQMERTEKERKEKEDEVKNLEETVRDLMFTLEAGMKIQEAGGADSGEGGDLVVVPGKAQKGKKTRRGG